MQDRNRYFDGRGAGQPKQGDEEVRTFQSQLWYIYSNACQQLPRMKDVLPTYKAQLNDWTTSLNSVSTAPPVYRRSLYDHPEQIKLEKKSAEAAVLSMTQNVQNRLEVKMRKSMLV